MEPTEALDASAKDDEPRPVLALAQQQSTRHHASRGRPHARQLTRVDDPLNPTGVVVEDDRHRWQARDIVRPRRDRDDFAR